MSTAIKIRVITDSASDLVPPYRQEVTVLPMTVTFGTEEFQDGIDLNHRQFYEKLIEGEDLPTTSQISPAQFEEAFSQAVEAGEILFEVDLQDLAEKMKAKQQDLQSLDLQIRGAVESEAAEERSGQLSRSQAQWYWIWRSGMAVSSAVPYRKSCLAGRIPASLR